jgi:His/Glu/Gln/Arg/opine family amino acid ABC transporter permease subunit
MGAVMINLSDIYEYGPALLEGACLSLAIASMGCLIGLIVGFLCAALLFKSHGAIRIIVYAYINLIRGTPMLIQILFLFFVLPGLNIHIPAFWTAVLAIGLNSGSYITNIIRSGITAVGKNQYEAAKVIGLSDFQTLRLIIFPQAFRNSLPTLSNEFITLVKDSSLASVIGVFELSKQGELMMHKTYDAMTSYTLVAVLYLIMTLSLSVLFLYLEKRMNKHASR